MDGIIAKQEDGRLARYEISSPHPEVSWKALFGKVWYEGYGSREYVWQSTGATDDFETKFSLVPLVFGTIKGTLYALLFAIPLAVMGALYTSQFMHPDDQGQGEADGGDHGRAAQRGGGLHRRALARLARRAQHRARAPHGRPSSALRDPGGALLGPAAAGLPARLRPGMEIARRAPADRSAAGVALCRAPASRRGSSAATSASGSQTAMSLVYDQRNCLVVGLAMGFAVIPIIFTISEDAFSSVPQHLTAASLALGASRWQTATRVVLPTASPGIFSAIMIGFGRAVGETMIVLMATGNTPVLDWSIFNGMRTLSANIAVEIPEAPYGGTLYRTLFLAGLVLFLMTFLVNTIAEVIRQRLRERYRAI